MEKNRKKLLSFIDINLLPLKETCKIQYVANNTNFKKYLNIS